MTVVFNTWNKPRSPTEKELREQMAKEGMKPIVVVMEKNETSGVIHTEHTEIRILVAGKVEICAEARVYSMKPGDKIELSKGLPYTAKNLERGQSVMLCSKKGQTVAIEIY